MLVCVCVGKSPYTYMYTGQTRDAYYTPMRHSPYFQMLFEKLLLLRISFFVKANKKKTNFTDILICKSIQQIFFFTINIYDEPNEKKKIGLS